MSFVYPHSPIFVLLSGWNHIGLTRFRSVWPCRVQRQRGTAPRPALRASCRRAGSALSRPTGRSEAAVREEERRGAEWSRCTGWLLLVLAATHGSVPSSTLLLCYWDHHWLAVSLCAKASQTHNNQPTIRKEEADLTLHLFHDLILFAFVRM